MADWYYDLRRAFAWALPDQVTEGDDLPEPFHHGLVDVFGGRSQVDFVHPVELAGATGFLIVRGDSAWLARFGAPDTTEVLFLGDMRGGRYKERLVADGKRGFEIEASYEHRRLGRGNALTARIEKPYIPHGTATSDETDYALERGQQLRQTFEQWSTGGPFQASGPEPSSRPE
jgi:hypothetical protein